MKRNRNRKFHIEAIEFFHFSFFLSMFLSYQIRIRIGGHNRNSQKSISNLVWAMRHFIKLDSIIRFHVKRKKLYRLYWLPAKCKTKLHFQNAIAEHLFGVWMCMYVCMSDACCTRPTQWISFVCMKKVQCLEICPISFITFCFFLLQLC